MMEEPGADERRDGTVAKAASGPIQVEGTLIGHYETGTEGVIWALQRNADRERWSYDDLFCLRDGDHLTIVRPDGSTEWEGVIDYDREVGYEPYPKNPTLGQQTALGFWVHGIQRGFQPDDWARLFLGWDLRRRDTKEPLGPAYRGILIRAADIWRADGEVGLVRYRSAAGVEGTWVVTYLTANPYADTAVRENLLRWSPGAEVLGVTVVPYSEWAAADHV